MTNDEREALIERVYGTFSEADEGIGGHLAFIGRLLREARTEALRNLTFDGLHPWERPHGDPLHQDRDRGAVPYDRQERRAANALSDAGFGGGDDPVGFWIASARYSKAELNEVRAELERKDAEVERLRHSASWSPKSHWRHSRSKLEYSVLTSTAEAQCTTGPILEGNHVTVYQSDDGNWWVRRTQEFQDGRFERIEIEQAPSLVPLTALARANKVVEEVAKSIGAEAVLLSIARAIEAAEREARAKALISFANDKAEEDKTVDAQIAEAHVAGIAEGQRQMRGAAAEICEQEAASREARGTTDPLPGDDTIAPFTAASVQLSKGLTAKFLAHTIRALPITPQLTDAHSTRIDNLWHALSVIDTRDPDLRRLLEERNLHPISEAERRDIARIARKQMRRAAGRMCTVIREDYQKAADHHRLELNVLDALLERVAVKCEMAIAALPDEMDPEEYPICEC